jgi:ATP-dependent DNA helicase RecQ
MNKQQILKQYFGYDTFRPLQAEIIDYVTNGNDCMVLMPTGGGKSVCYQIPALMLPGLTLVISPLIALMKDQVRALKYNGIAAEFINSSLPMAEQNEIESRCQKGEVKLLYISPEKLLSAGYSAFIQTLHVGLVAIDESHCVSVWGHDFRPEYTQLHLIKTLFPAVPMIALTATADRVTRKDILKQLGIAEAKIFIDSFDRPNLSLSVIPGRNRLKIIDKFIEDHPTQSGIIYCFSRKTTEDVAAGLRKLGINAKHYHAGMTAPERTQVQDEFLQDDVQVMVATVAFGMGIDKSNVRWIIHYNMPANVESFYQEIGRAGRDGLPADTLLFFSYADFLMRREMIQKSELPANFKEIQYAKLDRMKQYAEAQICRRRIMISYFNETIAQDCGNCDVCKNPPSRFDATIIAQKALSVVARAEEKVAMTMIIDILRGSHNKNLLEKGYQHLKTFGAGRELRSDEWAEYLAQMLNSGIVDIAYDEDHALKLNETSWKVLRSQQSVELIRFEAFEVKRARQQAESEAAAPKTKREIIRDDFFEVLRRLRKSIAESENIPPFVVFSDATLSDMAQKRPTSQAQMLRVSGVGQAKMDRYGQAFINKIREVQGRDTADALFEESIVTTAKPKLAKGETYTETYSLYKLGLSVASIAKERNLSEGTIYGHLIRCYESGDEVDLKQFISDSDYHTIIKVAKELQINRGESLKPLFETLNEKYDYNKLRIALTIDANK